MQRIQYRRNPFRLYRLFTHKIVDDVFDTLMCQIGDFNCCVTLRCVWEFTNLSVGRSSRVYEIVCNMVHLNLNYAIEVKNQLIDDFKT